MVISPSYDCKTLLNCIITAWSVAWGGGGGGKAGVPKEKIDEFVKEVMVAVKISGTSS